MDKMLAKNKCVKHTHTDTTDNVQEITSINKLTTIHTMFNILAKPCTNKYGFLKFRKKDDAINTFIRTTN